MLEYLLNTSTNVFCQYCPRRQGLRSGAALWSRCPASWPSPTITLDRKKTTKRRHHVWSVERFALFILFLFWGVCMGVWEWMCEWMPWQCHSCAQILDRGVRCLGPDLHYPRKLHQASRVRVTRSQPGELLMPGRKRLLWRLLERPLLSGNVGVCFKHIYKCFLSVLS